MATPDMDVIKEIPGYKVILKAILKSQIQQLVEQLASHTDEESVILTASVSDGTLCHLGSDSGKSYLEDHEEMKSSFLGFCLKRFHEKNQAKEREKEESLLMQQLQTNRPHPLGPPIHHLDMANDNISQQQSPRFSPQHTSPRQRSTGNRHQPYQTRGGRKGSRGQNKKSPLKVSLLNPTETIIKVEPEDPDEAGSTMVDMSFDNEVQPGSSLLKSNIHDDSQTSQIDSLIGTVDTAFETHKDIPGSVIVKSEHETSTMIDKTPRIFVRKRKETPMMSTAVLSTTSTTDIDNEGPVVKIESIVDPDDELAIMGIQGSMDASSGSQDGAWGHDTTQEQDWSGASESPADMAGYNRDKQEEGFHHPKVQSSRKIETVASHFLQCGYCKRYFSSKSDLTKHLMIHTGEKPNKCDICVKSFRLKNHLNKHRLQAHGLTGLD